MPVLIPLEARDEDGDGMIDLTVAPDNDCRNPVQPAQRALGVRGASRRSTLSSCSGAAAAPPRWRTSPAAATATRQLSLSPSVNVVLVRFHNAGDAAVETSPEFVVEGPDAAKPGKQDLGFGPWTVTGSEPFAGREESNRARRRCNSRARPWGRARSGSWP